MTADSVHAWCEGETHTAEKYGLAQETVDAVELKLRGIPGRRSATTTDDTIAVHCERAGIDAKKKSSGLTKMTQKVAVLRAYYLGGLAVLPLASRAGAVDCTFREPFRFGVDDAHEAGLRAAVEKTADVLGGSATLPPLPKDAKVMLRLFRDHLAFCMPALTLLYKSTRVRDADTRQTVRRKLSSACATCTHCGRGGRRRRKRRAVR